MRITHINKSEGHEDQEVTRDMDQEKKNVKVIEVESSGVCDLSCVCARIIDVANYDNSGQILCSCLGKDVTCGQICSECPMINKDAYVESILEEHKENKENVSDTASGEPDINENDIKRYSENEIHDEILSRQLEGYRDVVEVVERMIKDKVVSEVDANTLIWGALLLIHNTDTKQLTVDEMCQLLGDFNSRKFRA